MRAENIFCLVVGIDVRRDEVDRHIVCLGMREKRRHPGGLRGGGAANLQAR